jgi:hypothetical protein
MPAVHIIIDCETPATVGRVDLRRSQAVPAVTSAGCLGIYVITCPRKKEKFYEWRKEHFVRKRYNIYIA